MKIMVATTKGGLDDIISPIFGRCATFTLVDAEGKEIKNVKVVPNRYAGGMSGVGIQVAQLAAREGVNAVFAGNFGPNSTMVLNQAGIEIVSVAGMNVKDAVTKYLNKELGPTAQMPGAPPGAPMVPPMYGPGMEFGRGMGRRRGRGFGGWYAPYAPQPVPPTQYPYGPPTQPFTKEQELEWLTAEKEALENRLKEIKRRLEELK